MSSSPGGVGLARAHPLREVCSFPYGVFPTALLDWKQYGCRGTDTLYKKSGGKRIGV